MSSSYKTDLNLGPALTLLQIIYSCGPAQIIGIPIILINSIRGIYKGIYPGLIDNQQVLQLRIIIQNDTANLVTHEKELGVFKKAYGDKTRDERDKSIKNFEQMARDTEQNGGDPAFYNEAIDKQTSAFEMQYDLENNKIYPLNRRITYSKQDIEKLKNEYKRYFKIAAFSFMCMFPVVGTLVANRIIPLGSLGEQ
jgi:hypothetical protein